MGISEYTMSECGIDITTAQRKLVLTLLGKHLPNTSAWAYGSRVTWKARPQSDLDMVVFAIPEQAHAVANLKEAFEESDLPFRVDLFAWHEVPEQFQNNIMAEHVVLVERREQVAPEGWQVTTVGEFCPFIYGKSLPEKKRADGKYQVYGSNGPVGSHSLPLVNEAGIIIGRKGTVGAVHFSPKPFWPIDTTFYVLNSEDRDLGYTYYLLNSLGLNYMNADSAVPGLNREAAHLRKVMIPDLPEQRAIAHILGSLDDKIALNRRMNATLENMAQALFQSWFVDFDPVIDKAQAAGNPIPEPLQGRAAVRESLGNSRKPLPGDMQGLFPDAFEHTEEMGWVPLGWKVQPIYDIANFTNGAAYRDFHFTDEVGALPIVKIAEIKNGISGQTKFTKTVLAEKYSIADGDILFSWSGNPDTSIDTFVWTGGPAWLTQHIFKVDLYSPEDRNFVYYLLKSLHPTFAEIARDKQTTGFGHVTAHDMKRLFVITCGGKMLEAFNHCTGHLFDKWYANLLEEKKLADIRDTFLPKLLSGELRVADAEKFMEGV